MHLSRIAALALALWTTSVADAQAQGTAERQISIELRGIGMVPTFDIADAVDAGLGFGAGLGYRMSPSVTLMADFDMAVHPTPTPDFDINTLHYMGKIGYVAYARDRVNVTLNLGAGMMQFAGDLPESRSYFAINAGAKVGVGLSDALELLVSPQGDIAFADEDEIGTSNAWVWPLGVGIRIVL